jgi:hypothetical protein
VKGDKLTVVFKKRIEATSITKSFKVEEQQSKPESSYYKESGKVEIEENKEKQPENSQMFKSAHPDISEPTKVVSFVQSSKISEDYEAKYNKLYDQYVRL